MTAPVPACGPLPEVRALNSYSGCDQDGYEGSIRTDDEHGDETVCRVLGDTVKDMQERRAFIVTACNQHAALIAANRAAIEALDLAASNAASRQYHLPANASDLQKQTLATEESRYRAALALAREVKS